MTLYALIILVPFVGASLVPLVQLLGNKTRNIFSVIVGFAIAAITLALIPSIKLGSVFAFDWIPVLAPMGINLDALSINIAVIAGTIGSLIVLYSVKYMEKEEGTMRYYALTLLFIGAMIGLVLSDNFLMMYVFWEIVGLCSYALIGFYYKSKKAVNAGIKAFITTRIGDAGLLAGILVLFLNTGTFNISKTIEMASTIPPHVLAFAAFGFMIGAIGKSAQVPLHVWLPDAMEAPTTTSALIHAATMVNAGVYLMARVFPMFSAVPYWADSLAWIGAITALLAASMALTENDLKRVLAYSTVSQLGFMMLAIGAKDVFASQFHLMSHAIFKALLFLSAGAIIHATGTKNMQEMGGLFKKMKITGVCFTAGALSLMGIPLFNGFFSKDLIFAAALHSGNMLPFVLAFIAAIMTILYTLRSFNLVFLGSSRNQSHSHDAPWQMTLPLIVLAFGTISSWLLVSKFNTRMIASGIESEHITFIEFLKEMFLSRLTVMSLSLILIGLIIFFLRKPLIKLFSFIAVPYLKAAEAGFWFDTVYYYMISLLFGFGSKLLEVFDKGILDRFNYLIGSAFYSFSTAFRKSHTGEVNFNLLGMAMGIVIIFVLAFWR